MRLRKDELSRLWSRFGRHEWEKHGRPMWPIRIAYYDLPPLHSVDSNAPLEPKLMGKTVEFHFDILRHADLLFPEMLVISENMVVAVVTRPDL